MREITFQDALREGMREEMRRDPTVLTFGEDVQIGYVFGVTKGLLEEFGEERVMDTPISENVIVGAAIGAAMTGLRPIAEIQFSDFLTLCMDQLVNEAAKLRYMTGGQAKVPMVVRTPGGILPGFGPTHNQNLEAWFIHVPGLKVVIPSTPRDAKGLLKSAIRDDNPVVFFEHKSLYKTKGPVPEDEYTIPIGVSEVKQEGSDVTIVAIANMVQKALAAARTLKDDKISVEVVDPRSLLPMDKKTIISSVQKTGRLVIAEEGVKTGGVGAEIGMVVAEEALDYLDAPIARVAAPDVPIPCSNILEEQVKPSEKHIIQAIRNVVR
ncbi:MAG: alpha-ketoacid dehydrogenase subunit beta [Candidatus Bathyarchaeia archaeon]